MTLSPTPEIPPQVLIVGAGAAGLTLAIDLARRNVPLRLIDKLDRPFAGSRGKGIQPRSQEVFEDLGVLDRMAGLGAPYPPVRVYTANGFADAAMMERRPASPAEPYGEPLMLAQNLTEAVLRARLAEFGVRPEFGSELRRFEQDDDDVTAQLETAHGPETVRADYLIGADGGGSFVRRALGVGFPGETLPGRGLVADVALTGLNRDAWHMWPAPDNAGRLALCPLAGTDLFQLQTGLFQPRTGLPQEGEADLSDQAIAAMIARGTGRDDIVLTAVHWRSAFGMNARLADRYRSGRVFLAGDAAHVHPPTGGQGLNTSIQDGYALGWRLAAVLDGAPDNLLDSYEAERRPIALGVLGLSTGLLASGDIRRGREHHQLELGYLDSSLTLERRARTGRLQAGARAPDAPCQGAGGKATRLFEVFRGPQWTLLGYGADHAQQLFEPRRGLSIRRVGQGGDILDADGAIAVAYDLDPGDWVLVRPDGYVAAICSADEAPALREHLNRVGLGDSA